MCAAAPEHRERLGMRAECPGRVRREESSGVQDAPGFVAGAADRSAPQEPEKREPGRNRQTRQTRTPPSAAWRWSQLPLPLSASGLVLQPLTSLFSAPGVAPSAQQRSVN